MNKFTRIALAVATAFALGGGAAMAADTPATDSSKSLPQKAKDLFKSKFSKADKDNDGTLDKQESAAMPEVAAHFDAMDTDADGTVSRDEVKAYAKFAKEDKDKDGTLDKDEAKGWSQVSKNFESIDTDHEGTVSLAEINAYMMAQKSHSSDAK